MELAQISSPFRSVTLFLKLLPSAIWPSSPPLPPAEAGAGGAAAAAATGAAGGTGALAGGGGGGMSAGGGGGGGTADDPADDRTGEVGTDDTVPARVLSVELLALRSPNTRRQGGGNMPRDR